MKVLEGVFAEDTNACRRESTAYILAVAPSHNGLRVNVYAQTKSGRYARIWVRLSKLRNIREVEVSDRNPFFDFLYENGDREGIAMEMYRNGELKGAA